MRAAQRKSRRRQRNTRRKGRTTTRHRFLLLLQGPPSAKGRGDGATRLLLRQAPPCRSSMSIRQHHHQTAVSLRCLGLLLEHHVTLRCLGLLLEHRRLLQGHHRDRARRMTAGASRMSTGARQMAAGASRMTLGARRILPQVSHHGQSRVSRTLQREKLQGCTESWKQEDGYVMSAIETFKKAR